MSERPRPLAGVDGTTWVLLLAVPVLFPLWWYNARPAALPGPGGELDELWRVLLSFVAFAFLLGLLPLLELWWRGEGLRGHGLGLGDVRLGLRAVLLGLPLCALVAWSGAGMPEVRAEYPLCRLLATHAELRLPYWLAYAALYYVAWEWCFRGWMLFGLARRWPPALAVLLQAVPSALVHLGKPIGETLGAVPFGLVLGWLALRTRSIWYGWSLHVLLGVLTDAMVLHG
ncbi:MAG: CPBP family intramembrane metalloprotease [Planctomycetes bacterium]|nr:CPBP family intramembrane metalloprotease [Planctomycetota bacterium]